MKVFLVGEGRNDLGDLCDMPQYRKGDTGYFRPLLRTMLGASTEIDGIKITLLGRDQPKSKAKAARKKAHHAVAAALAMDAEFLVYTADGDNDFASRRRALATDLANDDIPWAIAMPKATVEAWLLGDSGSRAAIGVPGLQRTSPESLWGNQHDPTSNHPKQVLRRLTAGELRQDHYDAGGAAAQPSRLCTTCPESFRPFAIEVAAVSDRPACTP